MKQYQYLPDVLLIAGAAAVSYGAWSAWPPAGFMAGGFLLLVAGFKTAMVS